MLKVRSTINVYPLSIMGIVLSHSHVKDYVVIKNNAVSAYSKRKVLIILWGQRSCKV